MGSFVRALGAFGLSWCRWVLFRASGCRWVHPKSLGAHARALGVVGFMRGRWVCFRAPWVSLGSSGFVVFA